MHWTRECRGCKAIRQTEYVADPAETKPGAAARPARWRTPLPERRGCEKHSAGYRSRPAPAPVGANPKQSLSIGEPLWTGDGTEDRTRNSSPSNLLALPHFAIV